MIGISQLQFPSKDSSRLKFASYFVNFVALSILVNPANAFLSFATIFFRAEIKTFYIYKEIKAAKREKITKKDYWEIFFKNNMIKLVSFFLFSAFITYLTFTTTFLLISFLATIPLTMVLILLQSELRPKDFNPVTLFKASISFFLEGVKENVRASVNKLDNAYEHLLPHQLNDDIVKNIDKLKDKYCEQVPEDVIKNDEYIQFIRYIDGSYEFSDEDKGRVIEFLGDFCKDDQKHSSGFTGGQILLLVLKACNDGDREAAKNKKDALITNLLDSQTFSRKERIPNTCFTGIVYRMLSTLEGIHPDPEIRFTTPQQISISEAENEARKFMLGRLKNKKNSKEILKAWHTVQNNHKDNESQKIVDGFISEVSIPLMRKLLSFFSQYSEQIVLTLMKNISSIGLNKLQCLELVQHMRNKLQEHSLGDQGSLLENIGEKVFLELLNQNLLKTDFSLKDSSLDGAKRIANKIIIGEVEKFRSEAAEKAREVNPIEVQVDVTLRGLSTLPREKKCCIAYSRLSSQYEGDERETMENILLKKLEITKKEMNKMLEENDIRKLKLALDDACKKSGKNMEEMIKEVEEVVSSRLSHEVSVSNIAAEAARL
ncbi:hypothetical protein H9I48_02375 [Wolbachia pipientis]|uniref:hypothetical protein n=1 Tax=Wolbachia pipientis TaxID=955 RepID=UPI001650D4D3|nr:hypothetical protein [Wolbachia pipientis]MBC6686089.1 hypothetical protein [Wolbachia pipientis]